MLELLWKKIIRRKGISFLSIPAVLLWLISIGYRVAVSISKAHSQEKLKLAIPVISIGNITVGGTGKTPILSTIARFLINEGHKVGIVSSAYGRTEPIPFVKGGYQVSEMSVAQTGDEVMLLANLLPEAIFSVDRVKTIAAQNLAKSESKVEIILLDDGFQHFGLHRDIDIVTYDAAVPPGQFKMFPYGVLREPMDALQRADVIIITRSKFAKDIARLTEKLQSITPRAEIYSARFLLGDLVGEMQRRPLKYLEDKSVVLFAGIGNFRALERQVRGLTRGLGGSLEYSDHQVYTSQILKSIKNLADKLNSDVIITTGKDWFKVRHFDFGRELYYLSQIVDIDPGEERLISDLLKKTGIKQKVG